MLADSNITNRYLQWGWHFHCERFVKMYWSNGCKGCISHSEDNKSLSAPWTYSSRHHAVQTTKTLSLQPGNADKWSPTVSDCIFVLSYFFFHVVTVKLAQCWTDSVTDHHGEERCSLDVYVTKWWKFNKYLYYFTLTMDKADCCKLTFAQFFLVLPVL